MDQNWKIDNPFDTIMQRLIRIEELLLKMQDSESVNQVFLADSNLSIQLAVRITGLKKKTIYNLVCKRMIPHSKRGKRLYFDEQELKDWIKKGKRKTIDELGIS
jgi:excisionase family DNA binding protein